MDSPQIPLPERNTHGSRLSWQPLAPLIVAGLIAIYFLWSIRAVLTPFLIAFFLASLLDPIVSRLERGGMSRGRAVANIYLSVLLVIIVTAALIIPAALRQATDIIGHSNEYQVRIENTIFDTIGISQETRTKLTNQSGPLTKLASSVLQTVQATAVGIAGQVLWLIIIPLSLFYFLLDYQALRTKLISFAPARYHDNLDKMSLEIVEIFSTYVRSLGIVCAAYGAAAAVLFFILGLKYALFLGVAAGLLYAVPYVGPALAIGSAAVTALLMQPVVIVPTGITLSPVAHAIVVVVLFLAVHFTFDYGVTPKVVGGSVGLHPLVNIFALMCGATMFGIWGMLLAVPVAASIQMLLIYFFPKLAEKPAPLAQSSGLQA